MSKDKHHSSKWQNVAEQAAQDQGDEEKQKAEEEFIEETSIDIGAEQENEPSTDNILSYEDLKTQFKKEEARANEYLEKSLRIQAEMENLRRRVDRDVANARKYALEKFVDGIIPVVDSLERGMEVQAEGEHDGGMIALKEGMDLTLEMLLDTLSKFGIEQVNPMGKPFDPAHHEAISMQPAADAVPNTVIAVIQKGYLLNGRLVRPALVIVAQEVKK